MIRYLKRQDVDVEKYNRCIENSINSRIYAYSWYLDIVADNWGVLVLRDYEAVMPLPYMKSLRRLFLRRIQQPRFCQQLGVFSIEEISNESFSEFISLFLEMSPLSYNLNSFNSKSIISHISNFKEKVNYELDLSRSYSEIRSGYSKNLKRNIAGAKKKTLKISNQISVEEIILMKKNTMNHKIKKSSFKILQRLMNTMIKKDVGVPYGVFYHDELIASAFVLNSNNRIIHLFSSSNEVGRLNGAISFLFDSIIMENEGGNMIFDFEGSMIPGVAKFFKSFGSKQSNYNIFQK